jgi:hypothetical protein
MTYIYLGQRGDLSRVNGRRVSCRDAALQAPMITPATPLFTLAVEALEFDAWHEIPKVN